MSASCGHNHTFDGLSDDYKRRLWLVIALNGGMFVTELIAGAMAGSVAMWADSLDFLADAATYGLSLAVIGMAVTMRAKAALVKGISLLLMGLWVFGATVWQVFVAGVPSAEIMGAIGVAALAANVASVLILMRYKDGDANVRSVWLCSRNDAIGNVAVMLAALGVWSTGAKWPDLLVAGIMASLFLSSSVQIVRQSLAELRAAKTGTSGAAGHAHDHAHDHDHAHGHDHAPTPATAVHGG